MRSPQELIPRIKCNCTVIGIRQAVVELRHPDSGQERDMTSSVYALCTQVHVQVFWDCNLLICKSV
jgi:hypothetical protein